MYRNPLGGDLSDYNSLKKQRDYGARVKKYEKIKLETKPNELQKYYQYLTYQQPILDDLNYISERMRNEDIKKQKEDFNIIKDIHKEEETKLKDIAKTEKDLTPELKNELFDEPQVIMDLMPTINSELEMETPPKQSLIQDLGFDFGFNFNDIFSDVGTNNSEELFQLSNKEELKEQRRIEKEAQIQANKERKAKEKEEKKALNKQIKEEKKRIAKEEKKALKETKNKEFNKRLKNLQNL